MKLSIIMPVYNVEQYLEQCLDSVLSQVFNDFELICVNDCSTDKSLEVLQKYSANNNRISVISNDVNLGVGISRNIGLEQAQGEYIHFIDPDDWLEPDCYTKLFDKIYQTNYPDVLHFKYNIYNNTTGDITINNFKNEKILDTVLNPVKNEESFDNWSRYCWQKLHKREFLLKNNIRFKNYKTLSDVEHSTDVYINCTSLVYTDIVVLNYRILRKNSLVLQSEKYVKNTYNSFINNRTKYQPLPDNLKYRMLGADYFLLRTGLPNAYKYGYINLFEFVKMVNDINKNKEYKKYRFDIPEEYGNIGLEINIPKELLRIHCYPLFRILLGIKKIFLGKNKK